MDPLMALGPLDGRYCEKMKELQDIFSEFGLIKARVFVEIQWLRFLRTIIFHTDFELAETVFNQISGIYENFSFNDALKVKEIEKTTNHDVKAVEYFIKAKLEAMNLSNLKEWVHFACTSEDVTSNAYALMFKEGRYLLIETIDELVLNLERMAREYQSIPMLSRTHGQAATPTTVGKEMINFADVLSGEILCLEEIAIEGKMNGAVGNFNAHSVAFPGIDWIKEGRNFLDKYLNLGSLLCTTQVNPNIYIARILHSLVRIASIVIKLDRDMWGYISLGYFKQKLKDGEVGSSTMPHKVNPIDFENSEGNTKFVIGMMEALARELPISRFQRDLSDSTMLRNCGLVFGHVLLALNNTIKGLGKLEINKDVIKKDLEDEWALLAEPIQTVMRVYGEENPYERLKALTRGVKITKFDIVKMIESLKNVPEEERERLRQLTPENYTGLAEQIVDMYFKS